MIPQADLYRTLHDVFGFDDFRLNQLDIIENALSGRDSLVVMPTGGGKSMCFQLPALVLPGLVVVVSPLIALMQDQVTALREYGIKAAFLNSTLSSDQAHLIQIAIRQNKLDLLYLSPERLVQPGTLEFLSSVNIDLIAIDEAHCVSQWGHDFRPDYLELAVLSTSFKNVPKMALTATADERTRLEIVQRLKFDDPRQFINSFDRPNIYYEVIPKNNPQHQLLNFLKDHQGESGIVYCLSRKSVETVALRLKSAGFDALPYHAGLEDDVRASNQDYFLRKEGVIIVATIAFGMGIDKPDVRFVAHMNLPKSIEAYYQETGRAGRDGKPAIAWMLYGLQDVVQLNRMQAESQAPDQQKRLEREKLNALLAWSEVTTCRRAVLLRYFGEEAAEECGNCDTCEFPADTWDATIAAQKFLSCVYRVQQRFGTAHIIDVLRGKDTEKVRQHGHGSLSTYEIGTDLSEQQWRSVARQLLIRGFLETDYEHFNVLKLTSIASTLLKGEGVFSLRVERKHGHKSTGSSYGTSKASEETKDLNKVDKVLYNQLSDWRKQTSAGTQVLPYMVFSNATLRGIAEAKPRNVQELLHINGIGKRKSTKYGADVLRVVEEFMQNHPDTQTVEPSTEGLQFDKQK